MDINSLLHALLNYECGVSESYSKWYYVNTVGGNEAAIKKYIQNQEMEDQMSDQLSFKEYEDPFKDDDLSGGDLLDIDKVDVK